MKLLHLDIETSPNKAYVWGLFNVNVSIDQIVEPGSTLCWAAKWHGKKRVLSSWTACAQDSARYNSLVCIHALMSEADAVCTYNGNKFDIPVLNREFVLNGLAPINVPSIDLYRVVRSRFRFASNKLDFVSQQLGLGSKMKHKGMQMWRDCMDGKKAAKLEMMKYNRQDVVLLEALFTKLEPWMPGLHGFKKLCKLLNIGETK